jgi:hypothetical protein
MPMSRGKEQFDSDMPLLDEALDSAVLAQKGRLTPEEKLILERIYGPVYTTLQPYEIDEYSPTPLDAASLEVRPFGDDDLTISYNEGVVELMQTRLDSRLLQLGVELPESHYNAILLGIATEHDARVRQSAQNKVQLVQAFLNDPSSFSLTLADRIYLARVAGASQLDLVSVVASHPKTKISAIEQSKATFPLHAPKITQARHTVMAKLQRLKNENREFEFRELSDKEQRDTRRFVDLGELQDYGNIAVKSAIAKASFRGVNLTLKHRESFIALPPSLNLGNNPANVKQYKGEVLNIQPVGFSNYWSVDEAI